MDEHYINEMVRKLKPVLKDPAKAKVIFQQYWKTRIALIWESEDVFRTANKLKLALTRSEAITVLETLHNQHNAQYGIKWEDLHTHIQDHVLGRKLSKRELKRFVEKDIITVHKSEN